MANVCLYDGGNETSKEPYLNFFPTVEQMENYTMGKLVTDEVRLQLADLKVLKQRDLSLWPRAWIESTCTSYLCTAVTCWKYLFLAATTISISVFVFDTDFYVFIYVQAGIPYIEWQHYSPLTIPTTQYHPPLKCQTTIKAGCQLMITSNCSIKSHYPQVL
jgi:hypothetical protein